MNYQVDCIYHWYSATMTWSGGEHALANFQCHGELVLSPDDRRGIQFWRAGFGPEIELDESYANSFSHSLTTAV